MSTDLQHYCRRYDSAINAWHPERSVFFPNRTGRCYNAASIDCWFRELLDDIRDRLVIDPREHRGFMIYVTPTLSRLPVAVAVSTSLSSRYGWDIRAPKRQPTFISTSTKVKQCLGAEDPLSWKGEGPKRAASVSLWLYAAIWTWYIPTVGTAPSRIPWPWYPKKATPSFLDALASLRRVLWTERITPVSSSQLLPPKILDGLLDALATAV